MQRPWSLRFSPVQSVNVASRRFTGFDGPPPHHFVSQSTAANTVVQSAVWRFERTVRFSISTSCSICHGHMAYTPSGPITYQFVVWL